MSCFMARTNQAPGRGRRNVTEESLVTVPEYLESALTDGSHLSFDNMFEPSSTTASKGEKEDFIRNISARDQSINRFGSNHMGQTKNAEKTKAIEILNASHDYTSAGSSRPISACLLTSLVAEVEKHFASVTSKSHACQFKK
uniref:Uncharacterized protein n=1 Tax=Moniliophthora roreri TaxID=221103 RepID=A0A0W0FDD5_MONRR